MDSRKRARLVHDDELELLVQLACRTQRSLAQDWPSWERWSLVERERRDALAIIEARP